MWGYTVARKKIKDTLGSGQVQTDTYKTTRLKVNSRR